jgi:MoaA/NifB/PqqE/SkfB family radical SAM enzyme
VLNKKKISCGIDLLNARLLKKRFPLAVDWHLTHRCNYNCLYCDVPNREMRDELTTAEVFSIIDELCEMGTKRIHFCGGESLMRKDFIAVIDYCSDKSIETGLISNGALIPRYIKQLRNLKVLKLSLDGPRHIHDKLRGQDSYEKVMKAVESAKEEGIYTVLNCTLNSMNLPFVEFQINKSKELKIQVNFSPVNYLYSGTKKIHHLIPEKKKYRKVLDYIKKEAKKNIFISNSRVALKYISCYPEGKQIKHCAAGRIFCQIDPDGTVHPCERIHIKEAVNCKRDGIQKAFYSLPLLDCQECWCTSTLELNLIYSLNVEALFNAWVKDL